MEAFATSDDLATRLKRTFAEGAETAWIGELLEDASTYLRDDVIGQQLYPQGTVTFTAWPNLSGRIDLPQQPVQSVDDVTRDGAPIPYDLEDGVITIAGRDPVTITFTYGYDEAPAALKRWTCVLVSQVLVPLELKLGLTVGGLSSVQIDDFRAAFANAGEQTGIALSERQQSRLRQQWGRGHVVVVEATR